MKARGSTGDIQRAEQTLEGVHELKLQVAQLSYKLDAIAAHLGLQQVQLQPFQMQQLPQAHFVGVQPMAMQR